MHHLQALMTSTMQLPSLESSFILTHRCFPYQLHHLVGAMMASFTCVAQHTFWTISGYSPASGFHGPAMLSKDGAGLLPLLAACH